ncbi:unnamed protein product [Prunus armeniaca]
MGPTRSAKAQNQVWMRSANREKPRGMGPTGLAKAQNQVGMRSARRKKPRAIRPIGLAKAQNQVGMGSARREKPKAMGPTRSAKVQNQAHLRIGSARREKPRGMGPTRLAKAQNQAHPNWGWDQLGKIKQGAWGPLDYQKLKTKRTPTGAGIGQQRESKDHGAHRIGKSSKPSAPQLGSVSKEENAANVQKSKIKKRVHLRMGLAVRIWILHMGITVHS